MPRIDWNKLDNDMTLALDLPHIRGYHRRVIGDLQRTMRNTIARNERGRRSRKTPLTPRQRALVVKLVTEAIDHSAERAEALATDTRPRDADGNIMVEGSPWSPDETPGAPHAWGRLQTLVMEARRDKDPWGLESVTEAARGLLVDEHLTEVVEWLVAECGFASAAALDEACGFKGSLLRCMAKGRLTKAAAQRLPRVVAGQWRVDRVFGPYHNAFGVSYRWKMVNQHGQKADIYRPYDALKDPDFDYQDGDRLVLTRAKIKKWGDADDRYVSKGMSYPSATALGVGERDFIRHKGE